jgi:hypothetical protein
LKSAGRNFRDNLVAGGKLLTLDAGIRAFHHASNEAVAMSFSFSKAFAEIKSKSNASQTELSKWQSSLKDISVKTTANVDSMAESFNMLFNEVGNKDELLNIMESVGNAAAMGNGNAAAVAAQVQSAMHNEGKAMTKGNVEEYLNSANILRRHGVGIEHMENANEALAGINTKGTGLDSRTIANLMAAATQTAGSKAGTEAIKTLITSDLEKAVMLSSTLGLSRNKSGQLDLSSLGSADFSKKVLGLGNTDQMRKYVLKSITGASDEAAQALLDIAHKTDKFGTELRKAASDTETFQKSAEKAKDNLESTYKGMINAIIRDISKLLQPLETPLKSVMKTVTESPTAMGAAAVGTVAIGGALLRSILKSGALGKVLGGAGMEASNAASLTKNVGIGQALKQLGVQPVYVVNAQEIGQNMSMTPDAIKDLLGNKGPGDVASTGAKVGGGALLSRLAMAAGAAGVLLSMGNSDEDESSGRGQKAMLKRQRDDERMRDFGNTGPVPYKPEPMTIKLELDSKDPGYLLRPKATDNVRDARVQ